MEKNPERLVKTRSLLDPPITNAEQSNRMNVGTGQPKSDKHKLKSSSFLVSENKSESCDKLERSRSTTVSLRKTCVTDLATLREVLLKNPKNLSIDFSESYLFGGSKNDDDLKQIAAEVQKLESQGLMLLEFNLAKNKVTNEGVKHITAVLLKFPDLKGLELDLSGTQVTDAGLIELFFAIKQLKSLTYLDLEFAMTKVGNETGMNVSDLVAVIKTLTRFKLSFFKTSVTQVVLYDIVKNLAKLNELNQVDFWFSSKYKEEGQKLIEYKLKETHPECKVNIMWS